MPKRNPILRFIPDDYRKTIFDIDYEDLRRRGIRTLLVDLDNTALPYDLSVPGPEIIGLFARIRAMGFAVVVISNNHEPRVRAFGEAVGCPFVFEAKKPFASGFRRAVRLGPPAAPLEICVIGDQFVTDVWGGKRLGFHVVVVDALKRDSERWFTRLNRRWEKLMLKRIKKLHPDLYATMHLAEKR